MLQDAAIQDWGTLLTRLMRWETGQTMTNVLSNLSEYLHQPLFRVPIAQIAVIIPQELTQDRWTPAGPFRIIHGSQEWAFPNIGEPRFESGTVTWLFGPPDPLTLELRPGEPFRAELPLQAPLQKLRLVWDQASTKTFSFDAIHQPALLIRDGVIRIEERIPGIRVQTVPEGSWPKLPSIAPNTVGDR
jgi:hypothetical protein